MTTPPATSRRRMIATVVATALIGTVALAATGIDAYGLLAIGRGATVLGPLDCSPGVESIPPAAGVPTPALEAASTTGSRAMTCDGDGTSGYRGAPSAVAGVPR